MTQGDIFGGDPLTGAGTYQTVTGDTIQTDLSNAFSGRFYVSGGTLIDTQDPTNPLSLGREGGFTLQDVGNGRYALNAQIAIQTINRPTSRQVLRTVEGDVNVLQSDGTVTTLHVDATAVNQIGWQAVTYPQENGDTALTHVEGIYTSNAELQAVYGSSYRLATATEAIEAAVSRRLYLDNLDELKRIGEEEGKLDENGNIDLSGTIRWIMERIDMSNISAFSNYLFK